MDDTGIRIVAFASAIVPPLVVLCFFLVAARIQLDDELVWPSFGFGACAAFPAIVAEQVFGLMVGYGEGLYVVSANQAFWGAAIPEEICKLIALLCVCWKQLRELRPNYLFALSIACACGFACFENIFYVVEGNEWQLTAIKRSVSAVPGHAFVGGVMGFCIVRAMRSSVAYVWWFLSLLLPILLHGAYDFFLFAVALLEAQHVGELTDAAQILIVCFIVTVIVEGLLAHLALKSVLKKSDKEGFLADSAEIEHPALNWLRTVVESRFSWFLIGVLCLVGAILFFQATVDATESATKYYNQGFAAFSALHGFAFVTLAIVISRRLKKQRTEIPISSQ